MFSRAFENGYCAFKYATAAHDDRLRITWSEFRKIVQFVRLFRPYDSGHDLVRYGSEFDGGYLVPDDLDGLDACFSPGVAQVSDFEDDVAKKLELPVFMADASVEKPIIQNELFDFDALFMGKKTEGNTITLSDWVRSKRSNHRVEDYLLQMDIEGAEYDVLTVTESEVLDRFRIIVLEVHDFADISRNREKRSRVGQIFKKLLKTHTIIHLHPNNHSRVSESAAWGDLEIPDVFEITFIRADRLIKKTPIRRLPHPFDAPNRRAFFNRLMPECWFKTFW